MILLILCVCINGNVCENGSIINIIIINNVCVW